ncbi:MAG: serine/threonine protein kinase [Pirellulales bacterium]|nr:serine/threonine protein kinase [Pirellulales bacterium]
MSTISRQPRLTAPPLAAEALTPDVATQLNPPHDDAEAARHRRRVAVVDGAGKGLSDQTRLLLRARLRVAAPLVLGGSTVFLIYALITGSMRMSSKQGYASWLHIALVPVTALATYVLWRPALPSWRMLRLAEAAVFGMPALVLLALDGGNPVNRNPLSISAAAWCGLIFTYGMFIPNPWQRGARVLVALALAPILLWGVQVWGASQVPAGQIQLLTAAGLLLLTSAVVAVYGTYVTNNLRLQAFEARQLGQYRLRELLGSGGMGDVYLAEHQLLKRPCAIKLIDPRRAADNEAQLRFEREVRATARLSHWNTVEIFDYGRTDDGMFYYVMEFLPGLTLQEIVERHGPLPAPRVVDLLRQACDALREAHAQGLIHRDLKPGNLFASERGGVFDVVKLMDFGVVELMGEGEARPWGPSPRLAGSPLYMAPEQALGGHEPDARSDIYSLGAVAYYLLTGQPPFTGERPIKVLIAHAHDPVRPPSELVPNVPPDLEAVVLKALAKNPDERFADAASFEASLAATSVADRWSREEAAAWWHANEPERIAAAAG